MAVRVNACFEIGQWRLEENFVLGGVLEVAVEYERLA
jgi:hypothetical protein